MAWMMIGLGALVWFLAIWFWLRIPFLPKLWIGLLIPVWSLSPVPVENHPEESAPALFAAFYELFIAAEGNPGAAIAVLLIGTLLLTLALVAVHFARPFLARSGRKLWHAGKSGVQSSS